MKTIEILMFLVASLFLVGVAIYFVCEFVCEVFIIWKAKQPKPKITITSGLGPPPQGGSGVKDSRPDITIHVFIEGEKGDESKN